MIDAAYNAGHSDAMSAAFEEVMRLEEENAALRAKAALFDALAARIEAGAWRVARWEPVIGDIREGVRVVLVHTGERVRGATLAEAVEKAMEAEGGASDTQTDTQARV